MQLTHHGTSALHDNGSSNAQELSEAQAGKAGLRAASRPASVPPGGAALRRYRKVAMGLALSDALCVILALLASYALRYPGELVPVREAVVISIAPLVWIVVFYTFNLYDPQHLSAPEELRRVIGASGVGIVLLVVTSFWSHAVLLPGLGRSHLGARPGARSCCRDDGGGLTSWRLRMDGRLALRTLVVGTSAEATRLVEILQVAASGFLPLGHVQASEPTVPANRLPILGRIERAQTAWSGSMPPTACSSRPRESPKPICPGSRRWHARRGRGPGARPTCRRCSPPGWRS